MLFLLLLWVNSMLKGLNVLAHTLGCKVNQYETNAVLELLKEEGCNIVDDTNSCDIYIVNTCTVTGMSDRKSRQMIRKVRKENKDVLVVVMGCYAQVAEDEVSNIEGVNIVIGTADKGKVVQYIKEYKGNVESYVKEIAKCTSFEDISSVYMAERTRAVVKIQDGCDNYCSYCIIPYARGPVRSRDKDKIIREIQNLVRDGYKEIVLTGIHIASYGKDKDRRNLTELIYAISEETGIERIRISSVEPRIVDDEFIEMIKNTKSLCKHFHLSMQSGSDDVLKRMNRKYTTKEYMEAVERIRGVAPDAAITTDIIVGFPGETDEQFEETYVFVKRVKFSDVHIFKYSPRKGTVAAKFKDQVLGSVKDERSHRLIKLGEELRNEFLKDRIGEVKEVLVERKTENLLEGLTDNYVKVFFEGEEDKIDTVCRVKLNELYSTGVLGEED